MLADPWDLKHEIEQRQQQLYNMKLMKGQLNSSDKYQQSKKILQNSLAQSQPNLYLTSHHSHNQQQQNHSDDNSISKDKDDAKDNKLISQTTFKSNNDIQFLQVPKSNPNRKKYGNMIVFLQTKWFLLTLGPNYCFFFFAYICFTLATVYLVGLVNSSMESQIFKVINFCFCWLQNLSYILVALSNPGILIPKTNHVMTEDQIKNNRFCKKCGAIQQRKVFHCKECDVCITGYDHHCPWTSKCIGGENLKRFYFFVGMTPFYIFYYMVVFMICMASLTVSQNSRLKSQPATF